MQAIHFLITILSLVVATEARIGDIGENRIVGGNLVTSTKLYPWFVQGKGCGASLIAADVLMTAAHCASAFKVGSVVRFNSLAYDKGGVTRKILQVVKHPSYSGKTISNDYMLVKIAKMDGIKPIMLNSNAGNPTGVQNLVAVGFGATNVAGTTFGGKLKHVTLAALTPQKCALKWGSTIKKDIMVCAGTTLDKAICFGDSGGPLISTTGGEPSLVGISSFVSSKGCGKLPSVFARISGVYEWIKDTMCDLTDSSNSSCGGDAEPESEPEAEPEAEPEPSS